MTSTITPRPHTALRRAPAAALLLALAAGCADRPPTSPAAAPGDASLTQEARSAAHDFTYTILEIPGAVAHLANGINADGDIVGTYLAADGVQRGYLLRDGEVTPIEYPGAAITEARGVGPGGEIVGTYRLPGDRGPQIHGFLRTKEGEYLPVSSPGHLHTMPQRILPDGTILGCRHDHDTMGSMRGIVIGRDGYEETDAYASMHNGATPDGRRITGLYTDMESGRTQGYLIEDGVFTSFHVPGSAMTAAWDMSPAGDIVGVYRDGTGIHGFIRRGDEYRAIDVPGATVTQAFGINARGDVVGRTVKGGTVLSFLARRGR